MPMKRGLKGAQRFALILKRSKAFWSRKQDLENTTYRFELENGEEMEVKGNEKIEYDGEVHTAANLYDALKEGYYGKF